MIDASCRWLAACAGIASPKWLESIFATVASKSNRSRRIWTISPASGFSRRLAIDPQTLEAKFYELSRAFHPDFYQNKSDAEQTISLGNSAMLNTAYRTLRDPIQRAEYLLDLEAGSVKDIRTTPPADLFEEILELQDTLDEFRASDRAIRKCVHAPHETPL